MSFDIKFYINGRIEELTSVISQLEMEKYKAFQNHDWTENIHLKNRINILISARMELEQLLQVMERNEEK